MKSSFDLFWLAGNICAHTTAAVCFKLSAQSAAFSLRQIVIFVLGNAVGLFATVCLTMALKDNNPILIYGIIGGLSQIVLNLVLWLIFRPHMSAWQWVGIALIIFGTWLLHVNSPTVPEKAEAAKPQEAK